MKKKTKATKTVGNPLMAFRVKAKTKREIERVSKSLGYENHADFLREFMEVVIAGNIEGMQAMVTKATRRAMEQAQRQLPGLLEAPLAPRRVRR